ncbi:MAG: hypothetical protein R3D28_17850 [Geminicoccaceae bacterium]
MVSRTVLAALILATMAEGIGLASMLPAVTLAFGENDTTGIGQAVTDGLTVRPAGEPAHAAPGHRRRHAAEGAPGGSSPCTM